jgi:hypothetical protein
VQLGRYRGDDSKRRRKNERSATAGPWSGQDSPGSVAAKNASRTTTGHQGVRHLRAALL